MSFEAIEVFSCEKGIKTRSGVFLGEFRLLVGESRGIQKAMHKSDTSLDGLVTHSCGGNNAFLEYLQ